MSTATATKERPIIFTADEARAVLEGRKSVMRRVVKPLPPWWAEGCYRRPDGRWIWVTGPRPENGAGEGVALGDRTFSCPFGSPGEQLWARETWADVNSEDGPALMYRADHYIRAWHEFSTTFGPDYGAGPSMDYEAYPGSYTMWWSDLAAGAPDHGWKSPVHMPRWASRITLEITDVAVERLQDISEDEARAEGVEFRDPYWVGGTHPVKGSPQCWPESVTAFSRTWDRRHKPPHDWASNPWLWIVRFRRVEP